MGETAYGPPPAPLATSARAETGSLACVYGRSYAGEQIGSQT